MTIFTKTSKTVDRERPFHRINSPSFDDQRQRISGRALNCGCRSKGNYAPPEGGDLLFESQAPQVLAVLPAWVPVDREGKPSQTWESLPEVEQELEGRLRLSQHPSEDFPIGQWHLWYDWNFFIELANGFEYLRALGTHDNTANLIEGGTIECEWDCGAFGDYDFTSPGGPTPTLGASAPFFNRDWAWPVGGEYIWLAGRWIYDCGHPDSQGRARSELHPCKAVATARWEAVKFDENERHVPAIQFMFFACRVGGYWDFPNISGTDYEFIVDLPEGHAPLNEYPIGHTPDFPFNTLVVRPRPRLLVKFDYAPFTTARGPVARSGEADPEIELLPPDKPGELPKQVKVRVPLTKLGAAARNSYGVIMSLGWHDPERQQAEKVKEVRIIFEHIELHGDLKRFLDTRWLRRLQPAVLFPEPGGIGGTIRLVFRVGVNGRWLALDVPNVNLRMTLLSLQHQGETMYLAEDDDIRITCTGMEEDPSGEMMRRRLDDRTLKNGVGVPYDWNADFDQRDDVRVSRIADQMVSEVLSDAFKTISLVTTLSDDLGKVIPGLQMEPSDTPNPLKVKDLIRMAGGPGREVRGRLTARTHVEEHVSQGGVTTRKVFSIDYFLHYVLEYRDLPN